MSAVLVSHALANESLSGGEPAKATAGRSDGRWLRPAPAMLLNPRI
jgi:hypothetical protein